MAKVTINVNGRKFALGCDEGEQEHLLVLGDKLDKRVKMLADQFGQIGDVRLMLMASLTLMDELEDAGGDVEAKAEKMSTDIRAASEAALSSAKKTEASAAESLVEAAQRIERLAVRLAGK